VETVHYLEEKQLMHQEIVNYYLENKFLQTVGALHMLKKLNFLLESSAPTTFCKSSWSAFDQALLGPAVNIMINVLTKIF